MAPDGMSYPYNEEFISRRPEDVLRFYDRFRNRDQLISWMRNRPPGRAVISEVEGRKDLIVVIPTADVHGPMASRCREEVFKGQHIVFVESGGRPDRFFNFARYTNIGIRRALEYNPKWVAYAGDDAVPIDPITLLTERLGKLDPGATRAVYALPSSGYHSVPASVVRLRSWARFLLALKRKDVRIPFALGSRFGVKHHLMANWIFRRGVRSLLYRPWLVPVAAYVDTNSFGIYGAPFLAELDGRPFDEVYINAAEESDLAIRIWATGQGILSVAFRIGERIGMTLGTGLDRALRSVAGEVYLNDKIERGLIDLESLPRMNGSRGWAGSVLPAAFEDRSETPDNPSVAPADLHGEDGDRGDY